MKINIFNAVIESESHQTVIKPFFQLVRIANFSYLFTNGWSDIAEVVDMEITKAGRKRLPRALAQIQLLFIYYAPVYLFTPLNK